MTSNILQPPNNHLEDVLIAHVKLRDRPLESGDNHHIRSVLLSSHNERLSGVETTFSTHADARHCQSTTEVSLPMEPRPYASHTATNAEAKEASRALIIVSRRERHREGMVRFRKRQKEWFIQLEKDTCQLRQEVRKFELRRSLLVSCIPTTNNMWAVTAEFFRLFRYGIQPLDVPTPNVQLDFARAVMAPNVRCRRERCGAEALVDAWSQLSYWFRDVEVKLQRLEKYSDTLIVATTTTSLTITEQTLCNVFPHLWIDTTDKREDTLPLATRLLGERIALQGSMVFEWDSGYGHVTSITTGSDMLIPVLRLLGSLENVSRVFEHSLISPDFQW